MKHKPSEFSSKLSFYQSANNDNKSIKDNFIIRLAEFQQIINALKSKKAKDPLQHELVLGRRGSGKSTLLKRIQIEIDESEVLVKKYIAINLAEEQSSIYRLFDLWLEVINELEDRFDFNAELKSYKSFSSDDEYTRYLYDVIHVYLKKERKKLVLLLDNFDRIIENFTDDGNLLRETLINYNEVQIIGGSTRMSEHFWQYDLPFYEFFRQHRLESLSTQEMIKLILHWSDTLNIEELRAFVKNNRGKIEAIRILTDGLPRTLQFFIEILLDNSYLYGYEYLKKIMDKVTPVYQERLITLTPQLRKIITEMAFIWTACTTKQLVEQCRMESKLISANLKTLVDKGIVTKIETGKKNHLYRISERFFNMWFIITQGNPVQKRKAKWLSIFLECWYDQEDFKRITANHIKDLSENKIPYDKTLLISKAISQSKYTSTAQRDQIIDLVEGLNKINKDSLIQLPKRYKEIHQETLVLLESNKFDEAIKITKEIENEEDGVKFLMLGYLNEAKKDFAESEKNYFAAIDKNNKDALLYLATLYNLIDKFEEAEKYYLLSIENGDLNSLNDLGNFYHEQGRFVEAEEYYLLAIEKSSIYARYNLGNLFNKQNKFGKAEECYLMAIEEGNIDALKNLGNLYLKQDKLEKAEKYYLLAIEKGDYSTAINLALFYERQNNFAKAEEHYLFSIKKGYSDGMNNLGHLYLKQGNLEKAEKYYSLAIENGVDSSLVHLLTLFYSENYKKEEALNSIQHYNKLYEKQLLLLFEVLIEIWNGVFKDVEKRIEYLIQKFGTEKLEEILIEFLIHKQKNIIYNLFNSKEFGEELKERYAVVYFVTSLLVKPENKQIELSIPPEIKETVEDVMLYIEERQKFYDYKK
ncbi:tetratricopeptide repeat protein [Winogradskyella forsetii]|uniref:tetratricopeptide repeat protein n=1 Tax=Winogradskyella forsetii TaxID=2686077 RepID=UPI0015BCE10C|nr:tetratricopeptide repeat protein [Winogradskyella forsetii]